MRSTSYTDKHIKWIQENGADTSKTWKEVAEAFGKKFGIKKTANAIRKTFRLYADIGDDIRKGDKIIDTSNNVEYRVLGVSIPATLGNFQHLEIVITRVG